MKTPQDFGKLSLGLFPTPVHKLDNISLILGTQVFVKRDDMTGIALGGNKVRKLEYLLAEAKAQGAEVVFTTGGAQSNHAMLTAAAAKKLGDSLYYLKRQGMILAGGVALMLLVSHMDYHRFYRLALAAYLGALVLMILVNYTPFGVELNGKKRWFGIAGHSLFQAAELVKLAMILCLAVWITKLGKKVDRWPVLLALMLVSFPLIFLS